MPSTVLDRLLRPLLRGPSTRAYPTRPLEVPDAARGLPELDTGRCDATAACVTVCPTGAIGVTGDTWQLDAGRCVFCAACVTTCPQDAIRMSARMELATRSRQSLLVIDDIRRSP